jgi:hypothetical protein
MMATVFPEIDERLRAFIERQPVFFVATAPCLDANGHGGHVNLSPKGYRDTLAVLDPRTIAYLDLTGSGAETIAHLRQNGRITMMFCSFDRQPKILRVYGRGRAVFPADPEWPACAAHFPDTSGANGSRAGTGRGNQRAIIVVTVDRVADSCGYAVPVMELTAERDLLTRWAERRSGDELADYRAEKNAVSIDGLPAIG